MKKFLFVFTIFAGSALLILLSFSRETPGQKEEMVNIDFSAGEKLYGWNEDKNIFSETSFTGSGVGKSAFYRFRLSPIDSIYYKSTEKNPFTIKKNGRTNVVSFGSGVFICSMQTGLEKYEFHVGDITLMPRGRGVFLVDVTTVEPKIFSFDTFLDIDLVNGKNRSSVTHFTLFPSLLFKHNPQNTVELKEADILRVSIIDSIIYVDLKMAEVGGVLFSGVSEKENGIFLREVQKDITLKIKAFVSLYKFIEEGRGGIEEIPFFDTSSVFLINGSKKGILLKNILVDNLVEIIRNTGKVKEKLGVTNVKNTLLEMKELGPEVYNDGLLILKQYYDMATFYHFVNTGDSGKESLILELVENNIGNSILPQQGESYKNLSDLFSAYYFLDMNQALLNASFEKILQKILDNKVLSKNEFLPFVFFVTQYLSSGPFIPNEDTMLIIAHLYEITNDYYVNSSSDEKKVVSISSIAFYNYTRIFTKMYNIFLNTFVDKTTDGMLLKKEYLQDEKINLEQSFIDIFGKIISKAKEDAGNKENLLVSKKTTQADFGIIDNYTLLKTTMRSFDVLISMFTNYPKYLNDFHLNDSNRLAKGILVDSGNEMNKEALETYFQSFNNLSPDSLRITNNFEKDGFYEIEVIILGSVFHFKFWQQNHVIADITYVDVSGKKYTFPNITISLDRKKEQFQNLFDSSDDPALKYKYDFKNFFETTFLKSSPVTIEDVVPKTMVVSSTPEIQLFVQKELIDKDFKNIVDFLPIGFKSITATINSGSYIIELNDINKSFMGEMNNYSVELQGKYLFNRHSFSRLGFRVKRDGDGDKGYEFNDTIVEILPARISLLSLPADLSNLGYYIDTIKASYVNQQKIVIDLYGKRVLLDDTPFIPKFPTP